MKKFVSVCVACAMLLSVSAAMLTANAQTTDGIQSVSASDTKTYGNYKYQIREDNTVELTKYTGNEKVVKMPDTIDGRKVTEMGGCFIDNNTVTDVTCPKYLTDIFYDFQNCKSLKNIKFPDTLKDITESVKFCDSLEKINIPASVEGSYFSFLQCENLKEVNFQEGFNGLGYGAFGGCTSLKSITFPKSVSCIPFWAFGGCTSLEEVTIQSTTESFIIGTEAFGKCTSLKSIILPENLEKIWTEAFMGCTNLESVTILNASAQIGYENSGVFDNYSNLTLKGYKGSTTETYAAANNIKFVPLDGGTSTTPTYGNLDGDDKITAADSLLILRASVNLEIFTGTKKDLADVDGDGKITSADALDVLRYSVNLPVASKVGKTK